MHYEYDAFVGSAIYRCHGNMSRVIALKSSPASGAEQDHDSMILISTSSKESYL
jgi:hypothetical protein